MREVIEELTLHDDAMAGIIKCATHFHQRPTFSNSCWPVSLKHLHAKILRTAFVMQSRRLVTSGLLCPARLQQMNRARVLERCSLLDMSAKALRSVGRR